MKKLIILLSALVLMSGAALAQTNDLFISEYIEGSSYNKAVEIYNGTEDAVDLSQYALVFYFNGNSTGSDLTLDAITLEPGETFTVVHSSAAPELLALANQTSGIGSFNGDDVIILEKNGMVIDSMGTLGVDPGVSWSCAEGSTANHTLRRKNDVCNGDADETDSFDICVEWEFLPNDTFDGLGSHDSDCVSVADDTNTWDSLKALYR